MKETQEMMIKLPMVTAQTVQDLNKVRIYPQSGRYIVSLAKGDVVIADVELRPVEQGEARSYDEEVQSNCYCFVGQPELLDPDDWTLAVDLDNAKNAYKADLARKEEQLAKAKAELEALKEKHEEAMAEKEKECQALIEAKEDEYHGRYAMLSEAKEKELAMRRMELEHEFETKKLQLDLEVPKRFAQGEWVSGKTLTEIIKTLAGGKKEGK